MAVAVRAGTCCMACWMAQEDVCRCMCGGRNHGIMRHGGEQPGRYCQRGYRQYQLQAIHEDWYDARIAASEASKKYNSEHWLPEYSESAFEQHASGHMLKWPEVQAFLAAQKDKRYPDAYLVWVRMS